jgi:hypothetical protein
MRFEASVSSMTALTRLQDLRLRVGEELPAFYLLPLTSLTALTEFQAVWCPAGVDDDEEEGGILLCHPTEVSW